jgi:hypothetical protein
MCVCFEMLIPSASSSVPFENISKSDSSCLFHSWYVTQSQAGLTTKILAFLLASLCFAVPGRAHIRWVVFLKWCD